MYAITLLANGEYLCEGCLQDGTERWRKATLEEAVESVKQFTRAMNGDMVKRKSITLMREQPVTRTERVPMKWTPKGS